MVRLSLKQLKKLQNGSDIRGVALQGVPGEEVNLTPGVAELLGNSFAEWLRRNGHGAGKVAVGTDSRISGPALKKAFIRGLTEEGFDVLDCGLASTPAMFMTTIHEGLGVTGGVMLTASHLPFNRNGMKFFTSSGGFDKGNVSDLLQIASEKRPAAHSDAGHVEEIHFISDYAHFLVETIRQGVNDPKLYETPLRGMKIIVDAGNGAGGVFAAKVLSPLGADTSGSQFLEPDGRFLNHVPNPEDKVAMASICEAVVREKADLGIIFDTDVDRAALVDSEGKPLNRNELIALISTVILDEHPGSVIVTDSITSAGLKWFIEAYLGGVHHRFQRGYKNVINESLRLNAQGVESWLAIETSGHAALKENHFLDDGAYLVAKLLIQMAKMKQQGLTLSSLIEILPHPLEAGEFRLTIQTGEFVDYGSEVLEQLAKLIDKEAGWSPEMPNYEGIRVNCTGEDEQGWFLLRMSLHDPVLPLNVESNARGGVLTITSRLQNLLRTFEHLGLDALNGAS
ncbi:MAG: phosphomannomutase/phosphoglucomutase [Bacteroidia bacterium]|nr:MAG: phosphomannomutase/phosphoglucomutase [Bacteroidia bacterium]